MEALALKEAAPTMTREQWINGVAAALAPRFAEIGKPLPGKVRFTLSLINRKKVVGLCFPPAASTDEAIEILIRIDQDHTETVAGVLEVPGRRAPRR